jgi:hypothetical protein
VAFAQGADSHRKVLQAYCARLPSSNRLVLQLEEHDPSLVGKYRMAADWVARVHGRVVSGYLARQLCHSETRQVANPTAHHQAFPRNFRALLDPWPPALIQAESVRTDLPTTHTMDIVRKDLCNLLDSH